MCFPGGLIRCSTFRPYAICELRGCNFSFYSPRWPSMGKSKKECVILHEDLRMVEVMGDMITGDWVATWWGGLRAYFLDARQ